MQNDETPKTDQERGAQEAVVASHHAWGAESHP